MPHTPTLYLLPVPLSETAPQNVLPMANIDIVRQLKHFIVENVRSARRFLKACDRDIDIDSLTFAELNRHTPAAEIASMLAPMEQGCDMGIISEAGCPAIADPGADVVAVAQQKGYAVAPMVGPSSIIMALMGSGLNGQDFAFNGYLPIDNAQRAAKLKEMERRIRREHQTQIFIETPYRNEKLVQWLLSNASNDLKLCIASDITGDKQSIRTLTISKWKSEKTNFEKIPTIFLLG